MTLSVEVHKRLGAFELDVEFEAGSGITVLFGHSGAGKSQTLRAIAGLARPDSGRIVVDGRTVFDAATGVDVPARGRGFGLVVQDLALFPHMSVADNIGFGMSGTKAERRARLRSLLELLGLTGFAGRMPGTLSGGQQQRVALARALARGARLLLLDEPFSALDDTLRKAMRAELLRLRAELGLSVVFVTHDLREAHLLADRLAVFDAGRLLQLSPREQVFRHPVSRRVAELTGVANIFAGTVIGRDDDGVRVEVDGLPLHCEPGTASSWLAGERVDVCIRAERVILRRFDPDSPPSTLPNRVVGDLVDDLSFGNSHILRLRLEGPGPELEVELGARPYEVLGGTRNKRWVIELPPSDLHLMQAEEQAASSAGV